MQETGEMEREKICVRAELFGGDAYYCTRGRVWEESKYDVGEIVDTRSIACGPPHMTRWHDDLRSNCFKQKRMARSISTKTMSYIERMSRPGFHPPMFDLPLIALRDRSWRSHQLSTPDSAYWLSVAWLVPILPAD